MTKYFVRNGVKVKRKNGWKMLAQLLPFSSPNCPICGEPLDLEGVEQYINYARNAFKGRPKRKRSTVDVNIDHKIRFALSGDNSLSNLQLVHPRCNSEKG